jgi:multidrug efflux system outer membrane protein
VRAAVVTLTASLVFALAGCATPTLESTVEVPDQYAAAPQSETGPEVAWWENFHDPVLADLILRAARENRDVRIAAERLRAARAGATISRSWLMPSISGVAGYNHQETGYDWPITEKVPDTKAGGAGLDVSWEVDLAGGLRAGARAAEAYALAAEHGVRGVRLLVLSDVATNYFMLVGAMRQLETVRSRPMGRDTRSSRRVIAWASARRSTSSGRGAPPRARALRSRRSRPSPPSRATVSPC